MSAGDIMITDMNGIKLTPGNHGEDCNGNGKHFDNCGNLIECCCDECDYLICCTIEKADCENCTELDCVRKNIKA